MNYSIDTVARLTGISAFTLRNWEKRYAFLKPNRLANGFRAYDDTHVELLKRVQALLRHGARIGDLAENIRKGKSLPEVTMPHLAPEVEERAMQLFAALMDFDLRLAEEIHTELNAGYAPTQMLDLIYSPLLGQVGRAWNAGEATLAQEHFASAFIRLRLAQFLTNADIAKSDPTKTVICATTSGELHEGGLMLVSAHLKLRDWTIYYLGANLPIEEVQAAAKKIRPKLVCLSFMDKHGIHASLDQLGQFACTVAIGGFGALTFDAEETLPPHLHLFKTAGRDAAERIERINC